MLDKLDILDETCFNISIVIYGKIMHVYSIGSKYEIDNKQYEFKLSNYDKIIIERIKEDFKDSCEKLEISFECYIM